MEPLMTTPRFWDAEQVVLCSDPAVGLRAVFVIDDTRRGPGLGGIRFRSYPDDLAGIDECRRLAAGMTLKNAIAELPFGGAKAVIFDRGPLPDRRAAMRRFGEFVARAGGSYLPGVDMGTTVDDLAMVGEGGAVVSCSAIDPSEWTARGVCAAIRAVVEHVDGSADLDGVRVLIQGAGHVGRPLAASLADDGAAILVADVDGRRAHRLAERVGGAAVDPGEALSTPCDVLVPCAAAGLIGPATIPELGCRMIAGAANDTLAGARADLLLAERGIVYVPDFVANAGGVIQIHAQRSGWQDSRLGEEVDRIGDRVTSVLSEAADLGETPLAVAIGRARALVAEPASEAATGVGA